ncbi:hypothetical protein AURDEDRAFT_164141 [Auricularia subglabra TFB-10046 SS5]|nr:hypothetical protein AURDEDRAFT_164141 [Auricularia subglabra TFB-10046 SS5]
MRFLAALSLTVLVATRVYAAVVPTAPSPGLPSPSSGITSFTVGRLVSLLTVESSFGNLTYYGHNTAPPPPFDIGGLEKRCGSNAVGCDGGNVPNTAPCASLIYGAVQTSSDVLPDFVRAICLNSNGQCCISWGKPTSGLRITTLFKAANTAFASCVASGKSGFTRDTGLNGVCTDQCLSNRPDGTMISAKILLLATLIAVQTAATPAPGSKTEDFVVVATKETQFGTLTYYGLAAGTNATALSARACGSNDVLCDTSNVPAAATCSNLINALTANAGAVIPTNAARSVCLTNGNTCCVSWHNTVPNMPEGDLIDAANAVFGTCVVNGLSGATTNTLLNGVCTRQCLSNRATEC